MKSRILFIPIVALAFLLFSCEIDNFDAPAATLSGSITYNNESVGVRSRGLELELWQHGYENFVKIPVHISQDGTYSASLFDGAYKLVRMSNGPWENNTDSIDVVVKGNTVVDVPVIPYFTVSGVKFSNSGKTITATFTVNKISTQRALQSARLFIGKTIITDNGNNIVSARISAPEITLGSTVTLTATLPENFNEKFVYARVGVETEGIGQLLYSTSEKIDL